MQLPEVGLPVEVKKMMVKRHKNHLGNEMFIGRFEKLQHIPGNLEDYVHVQTMYMPRKKLRTLLSLTSV